MSNLKSLNKHGYIDINLNVILFNDNIAFYLCVGYNDFIIFAKTVN